MNRVPNPVQLSIEIMSGLEYLHSLNIIHRCGGSVGACGVWGGTKPGQISWPTRSTHNACVIWPTWGCWGEVNGSETDRGGYRVP